MEWPVPFPPVSSGVGRLHLNPFGLFRCCCRFGFNLLTSCKHTRYYFQLYRDTEEGRCLFLAVAMVTDLICVPLMRPSRPSLVEVPLNIWSHGSASSWRSEASRRLAAPVVCGIFVHWTLPACMRDQSLPPGWLFRPLMASFQTISAALWSCQPV